MREQRKQAPEWQRPATIDWHCTQTSVEHMLGSCKYTALPQLPTALALKQGRRNRGAPSVLQ